MMDLEYFKNKKILLTGGNGYLAYNLISTLKNIELEITRFDLKIDNWSDFDGNLKIKIRNIEGDIRDRRLLESVLQDYDIIFHFAAQTSIYVADSNPTNDLNINVLPLVNILDICEKKLLKPVIIFAGTATEVGLAKSLVVDEKVPDYPVTIYDLNKSVAENYLGYYCRKGFVKGATLRLANVYGPGPKNSSKDRGIVNFMIKRAIENLPLTLYGNGEYTRDYIYIQDVINAFLSAAKNIDNINGQFFYIGTGRGHTIVELFRLIVERTYLKIGSRSEIQFIDPPDNLSAIETRSFIANNSRFLDNTDWKPMTDLKHGIDSTITFFVNNKLI
jgi:nucleoside-diphosphate-sugar epimerase